MGKWATHLPGLLPSWNLLKIVDHLYGSDMDQISRVKPLDPILEKKNLKVHPPTYYLTKSI
jgi:hypothetical protein